MNEELESRLQKSEIKPTAMRLLVLQYMTEQSASVSLNNLEAAFYKADKSTLYRTLKTFEERKLIHSIDDGTGSVKYALCLETCACALNDQHFHFHCSKCGETFCLTNQSLPPVELPVGFSLDQANLVLKGICANCNH